MNEANHGPLREDGPFGRETFTFLREDRRGKFVYDEVYVVYADSIQPSHSVWLVPGTGLTT